LFATLFAPASPTLFMRLLPISIILSLLTAGLAQAQTITAKLTGSPLFLLGENLPLSVGSAVEVGVSKRSSLQLLGVYRYFPSQDEEPDTGPKVYFDYRYYPKPPTPNSGLYFGPYVGLGRLLLGLGDDPLPDATRQRRTEREAGLLVGHQAVFSWFTAEAFAGPAYRWETTTGDIGGSPVRSTSRFWGLRAGFTLGVRIRHAKQ
jgi:hypothetical protein